MVEEYSIAVAGYIATVYYISVVDVAVVDIVLVAGAVSAAVCGANWINNLYVCALCRYRLVIFSKSHLLLKFCTACLMLHIFHYLVLETKILKKF